MSKGLKTTIDETKYPNLTPLVFIFVFFSIIGISVCQQPSANGCSLEFELSSFGNNLTCDGGDWGGFLHDKCCGVAFHRYLQGLGEQANHTGKIYLNNTEQRNCLSALKNFQADVLGCGIERLTSGGGGCSDFSVSDVSTQLGDELKILGKDCELVVPDEEWSRACGTCLKRWNGLDILLREEGDFTENEPDVCRFAVLVSLASTRIEDKKWAQNVYKCLEEQNLILDEDTKGKSKNQISSGLWVVIGGLVGIVIVITVAASMLLKRQTESKPPPQKEEPKELEKKEGVCQIIPIKEIYSATNNLNAMNFIGQGIAGKVYKGILSNGQHVAIKHIVNEGHVETFMREVKSLSHVRHPNLVTLLGYCDEEDECFLVYELCPNGNLSEWLFAKDKILSWIQRLEIAIDGARGLWFLHTFPDSYIVHRDIKPTNILLGKNFEAKLSDFGLSKVIEMGQSYVSSEVRGTFGYVDPEYQLNHRVNSFGDVYSYGVVLLQLLSGKRVINLNMTKPMPLDKIAKFLTRGGDVAEFADPKLNGEYSTEAFDLVLKLAVSCTSYKQQRPSMEQVVKRLENALDISEREKDLSSLDTPTRV